MYPLFLYFLLTSFTSCFIVIVIKFVEPPENNEKPTDQKKKVKFKIMSLKVIGMMDYVPELVSHMVYFLFF